MSVRRKKSSGCAKCGTPMPAGAGRCMKCGAKNVVTDEVSPAEQLRQKRERILRKYNLTEVQKNILFAAGKSSKEIVVCGADRQNEGEVKAGDLRFYGNEAVAAVAVFVASRLIEPRGGDCFRVTPEGDKLIRVIDGEPTAVLG